MSMQSSSTTSMSPFPPPSLFHLAFPVDDLDQARAFYGGLLGCEEGRSSDHWVDFNFFGHQLVAHLSPGEARQVTTSEVDGKQVPLRHFGAVLPWQTWHALADSLKKAGTDFIVAPHLRFEGQTGEQATLFFLDPFGNALEFKSFKDWSQVFAC